MTVIPLLIFASLFLAYANGANDNSKGIATLFGSETINYKSAIWFGSLATLAGSICSSIIASKLVENFSGKGLVPDLVAGSPLFLCSVAMGAGFTVMTATRAGLPISTTHSITGALVGGGLASAGGSVNFSHLGSVFFVPLLVSPLIAMAAAGVLYPVFHAIRTRLGISKEWCLCAGTSERVVPVPEGTTLCSAGSPTVSLSLAPKEDCRLQYTGAVFGISTQNLLDKAHFISAGMLSFARGLNDTPKIAALLLPAVAFGVRNASVLSGLAIALGGILNARKVAKKIGKDITPLNHGQGFTANLVSALLVIFASRLGVPVSTTHVSVGALFGIGSYTREADYKTIRQIVVAWVLTLPIALIFGAVSYLILQAAF